MATKTANMIVHIQLHIKETAEMVLEKLGISVSLFIDMAYRQVIMHESIPFSLTIRNKLPTRDNMHETEFNKIMVNRLTLTQEDDSLTVEEAFSNLRLELTKQFSTISPASTFLI